MSKKLPLTYDLCHNISSTTLQWQTWIYIQTRQTKTHQQYLPLSRLYIKWSFLHKHQHFRLRYILGFFFFLRKRLIFVQIFHLIPKLIFTWSRSHHITVMVIFECFLNVPNFLATALSVFSSSRPTPMSSSSRSSRTCAASCVTITSNNTKHNVQQL